MGGGREREREREREGERLQERREKTPTECKTFRLLIPLWVTTTSVRLDCERAKNSRRTIHVRYAKRVHLHEKLYSP